MWNTTVQLRSFTVDEQDILKFRWEFKMRVLCKCVHVRTTIDRDTPAISRKMSDPKRLIKKCSGSNAEVFEVECDG